MMRCSLNVRLHLIYFAYSHAATSLVLIIDVGGNLPKHTWPPFMLDKLVTQMRMIDKIIRPYGAYM